MKKLLLTGIAALLLATGMAYAAEWQCGPHYVSTFGLHGWPGEEKARQCRDYHILAYPAYTQTREQAGEKSDDEIGLPAKGFRWGLLPHPEFKGTMRLTLSGQTMLPISNRNAAMIIRDIAAGIAVKPPKPGQSYAMARQ